LNAVRAAFEVDITPRELFASLAYPNRTRVRPWRPIIRTRNPATGEDLARTTDDRQCGLSGFEHILPQDDFVEQTGTGSRSDAVGQPIVHGRR